MATKDNRDGSLIQEIMALGSIGQRLAADRLSLMELVGVPFSVEMPLATLMDAAAHGKLIEELEDPANGEIRQKALDRLELMHAIRIPVHAQEGISSVLEGDHGLLLREIEALDSKLPDKAAEIREYVLRTLEELHENEVVPNPNWPLRQLLDHAEIEQMTRLHPTAEVLEQHAMQEGERGVIADVPTFRNDIGGLPRGKFSGGLHSNSKTATQTSRGAVLDGYSISHTTVAYDESRLERHFPEILHEWQENWSQSIPRREHSLPSSGEFLEALGIERHVAVQDYEAMKAGTALPGSNLAAVLAAKVPKQVMGKFRTFMWLAGHDDYEHPKPRVEIDAAAIRELLPDRNEARLTMLKRHAVEVGSWSNWVKNSRDDREMTLKEMAERYTVEIQKLDPAAKVYTSTMMNRFENGKTCGSETELLAFMNTFKLKDRDDFRREHEQQVAKNNAPLRAKLETATMPSEILDAAFEHDSRLLSKVGKSADMSAQVLNRMKEKGEFPRPVAERMAPALGIAGEPFRQAVEEYWQERIAQAQTFGEMAGQLRKRAGMTMGEAGKAFNTSKQRIETVEKCLYTGMKQTLNLGAEEFARLYKASEQEMEVLQAFAKAEAAVTRKHDGKAVVIAGRTTQNRKL